jgi:hypothetical protein
LNWEREKTSSRLNSLPSWALSCALPSYQPHILTPTPQPAVPGATICEFISALLALLNCHIAYLVHRQSMITTAFHISYAHPDLAPRTCIVTRCLSLSASLCALWTADSISTPVSLSMDIQRVTLVLSHSIFG